MKNHTKVFWFMTFHTKFSDEVAGFIRVYDGIRYIVLLGPEKYDAIYNRTRYLISQKTDVTYVFFLIIMQ